MLKTKYGTIDNFLNKLMTISVTILLFSQHANDSLSGALYEGNGRERVNALPILLQCRLCQPYLVVYA